MKHVASPILLIAAASAGALPLAATAYADIYPPNPPAPFTGSATSNRSAQDVVNQMQSNGYRVIVNRIGSLSLDQCAVTSLTDGTPVVTPVTAGAGAMTFKTVYTTAYLTADCTHPRSGQ
jgi:hypothetical protein